MSRFATLTDLEALQLGVGIATPSNNPVSGVFIYNLSEAGTYVNYGAIVISSIDLTLGLVQVRFVNGNWVKVITPINLDRYGLKSDLTLQRDVSDQTVKTTPTKNLIDTSKRDVAKYYSLGSHSIVANTSVPGLALAGICPVLPNIAYSFSGIAKGDGTGGYFDSDMNSLNINISVTAGGGGSNTWWIINVPNDARIAYVALNYDTSQSPTNLQLESGIFRTAFESFHLPVYNLDATKLAGDVPGVAKTVDFNALKVKTEEVIKFGDNYADKSTILSLMAYLNGSGVLSGDSLSRCLPPIFLTEGTWTISGINLAYIGAFYTDNTATTKTAKINEPTSTLYTAYTFTVPTGGSWVGLNVERVASGSPTGIYDSTVMLAKGTNIVYQTYVGLGVYGSKIIGDIPNVVKTPAFVPVKSDIDAVIALDYDKFTLFNGASTVPLPASYTLNAVGDYIEVVSRYSSDGFADGLGMMGVRTTPSNQNKLGYFSATEFAIRENDSSIPYIKWVIPGGVSDFKKYRLEVVSGGWKLSVNEVVISTQTKSFSLILNTIGNAYAPGNLFKGGIKSIKIHNATQDLLVTDLATLSGGTNIGNNYSRKAGSSTAVNPKCFFKYEKTGYSGKEKFTIYVQYEGLNDYYAGFVLAHNYDISDLVYQNLYKITGADLYKYTGGAMISQGINLLTTAESEFVYHQKTTSPSKYDFTGGYHGDEIMTDIKFFVDSVLLSDLSSDIALTACTDFRYLQKSTMHEAPNSVAGSPVFIVGHPIQAYHTKDTLFSDGGYKVSNRIKWAVVIDTDITYFGIACISPALSSLCFSENYNYVTLAHGADPGAEVINEVGAENITYSNASTSMGAEVRSKITKALNGSTDNTIAYNSNCLMVVWDVATYAKYYRRLLNKTTSIDEVWEGEMKVKFYKRS